MTIQELTKKKPLSNDKTSSLTN